MLVAQVPEEHVERFFQQEVRRDLAQLFFENGVTMREGRAMTHLRQLKDQ